MSSPRRSQLPRQSGNPLRRGRKSLCEKCTDRAPQLTRSGVVASRAWTTAPRSASSSVSRRAKITPQQAGLPDVGSRRVPGLRRGEVATLAGVSIEYYSKLERGALAGVSASVLDALARALQLDDAERSHLFHLAGAKHFHHHVVGNLELAYESVDMISEPGLTLTIYAAEPASPTAHALDLLASWTATRNVDTASQPT